MHIHVNETDRDRNVHTTQQQIGWHYVFWGWSGKESGVSRYSPSLGRYTSVQLAPDSTIAPRGA